MTPKEIEIKRAEAIKALPEIRSTLETEANLLGESYDARLVIYACLTTAIKLAARSGMDIGQFTTLTASTINLYAGGEAIAVVELPEE